MKKIFITSLFCITMIYAQNQSNMYISGDFNSWGATAMTYRSLGSSNWLVTFQYTGSTGSQTFKFRNSNANWDQNWSRGDVVSLNSHTTWYNPNGGNSSITLTNSKYYSFTFLDVANSTNSSGYAMQTSAIPISISGVSDDDAAPGNPLTVTITLSGSKSSEEHIFIRYTEDNWSTWSAVEATGSGTSYSGQVPASANDGEGDEQYYVLSTTLTSITSLTSEQVDLVTLSYDNDSGNNYGVPVELVSFSANYSSNSVELSWNTATEIDNYGFSIERLQNKVWKEVGFVNGHGNSNSPKDYSYSDETIDFGQSYTYRLKQIDFDGSYEYSGEVEVYTGEMSGGFTLEQNYPNPFNPETTIKFGFSSPTKTRLLIYNSVGEQVAELFNGITEPGRVYNAEFNGSKFASGVYYYKLITPERTEVRKMMLLK